jgi:hypothetical protein
MKNETIAAIVNGLDVFALLVFMGAGLFAVLKPEKAWKLAISKKKREQLESNKKTNISSKNNKNNKNNKKQTSVGIIKEPYMRMKTYGIILIIIACVGLIEMVL